MDSNSLIWALVIMLAVGAAIGLGAMLAIALDCFNDWRKRRRG